MAFGNPFTGSPSTTTQVANLNPQQRGLKGAVGNQAMNLLQGLGGNNLSFEPIAQKARTQFQTQTVPGLAERFTSLGSGAQRSSAFQGALGQAGAGLEEGLASLGSQYGLQKQGLEQQLLSMLLGTSLSPESQTTTGNTQQPGLFETSLRQQHQSPFLMQLLPLLSSLLGGTGGGLGGGINALLSLFGGR